MAINRLIAATAITVLFNPVVGHAKGLLQPAKPPVLSNETIPKGGRPADATFQHPTIYSKKNHLKYRLDYCRWFGKGCGELAAKVYCESLKYRTVNDYSRDDDIGLKTPTLTFSDQIICDKASCDGFKFISCNY